VPSTGSARRYARAVFEIARDSDTFDQWSGDLNTLSGVLGLPETQAFLTTSKVPDEHKQQLLDQNLDGVSTQARNLATLLVRRGRVHLAAGTAMAYQEMLDEHRGIVSATVTTAVPLDDDLRNQVESNLRDRLGGRELRLVSVVDESIVGGMVARVGDQVIDGSTRTRLRNMRDWLRDEAAS
jgi:F-type H+-transporting ATPase subunit delta